MKERPILFSGEMLRAILAGRKTQTRRACTFDTIPFHGEGCKPSAMPGCWDFWSTKSSRASLRNFPLTCPYGQSGSRLWVRESFAETDNADGSPVIAYRAGGCIPIGNDGSGGTDYLIPEWTDAEGKPHVERWKPSIFMPRWASRITLEITGVRVERLQAMTMYGMDAEGTPYDVAKDLCGDKTRIEWFKTMWNKINGPGSWDLNPWVWCIEFKPLPRQS